MGYFITGETIIKDTDVPGMKQAMNNQLYYDNDGKIYLCPKKQIFDGYTIPRWLAWIAGGRFQFDARCSRQHDIECSTHKKIVVNMSLTELKLGRYLFNYEGETYCMDLPTTCLDVQTTSFIETNKRFKRMLETIKTIPKWRVWLFYIGVHFNIGWWIDKFTKKITPIDLDCLYEGGSDKWINS